MKQILAVALLDFRRLGFGLLSAALIAGLVPALATGLGSSILSTAMAIAVFVVVGLACGGYFGSDFSQGRGAFFFARPLPASFLIIGRFLAMLTLAAFSYLTMMFGNWLSTSDRTDWKLWILNSRHLELLVTVWILALFMSLAIAAHSRQPLVKSLQDLLRIPLRLALILGAVLLTFGLFADLSVRMSVSDTPIRMFFGSWVVGCLLASLAAIVFGRTERLRITKFLNRVMLAHLALITVTMAGAWSYLLHPGPESIKEIYRIEASSDGARAFIRARVDRLGRMFFVPTFEIDPGTGLVTRLDIDPFQGPWLSADGRTSAWSEATPYFFRPLWRMLGGASSFRVKSASGQVEELPLPAEVTRSFRPGSFSFFNPVENVLPSDQGDVFAFLWSQRLTLGSRSTRRFIDVNLGPGSPRILDWRFLGSGELRVAVSRNESHGRVVEFLDVDPSSGVARSLRSMDGGLLATVRFDRSASRAVVTVSHQHATRAALHLVRLGTAEAAAGQTPLLTDAPSPQASLLADGRIAVIAGGRNERTLTMFSTDGARLFESPLGKGVVAWPGEIFPGVLVAHVQHVAPPQASELILIDSASGTILRRIQGFRSHLGAGSGFPAAPPPGSPAAKLLLTPQHQIYALDSPTAEPRRLSLTDAARN